MLRVAFSTCREYYKQLFFFLSVFFVTRCSSCCFKISVDAHVKHVNNFKLNPCSVPTVVVISICCVRFSTGELKGGILLHGLFLLWCLPIIYPFYSSLSSSHVPAFCFLLTPQQVVPLHLKSPQALWVVFICPLPL